ncbi:hypothetical protein PCASD_10858 [Puccinia coronata f. sp. avenae]|uniref:FCP1 homology domain-containing protein n=1 Tax=Puccinia coronata f. sp. avenae TaxID=200324 RepID=A0A2N5UU40_9BASI|nr:hypothetical protein PCASD_10858 [Puccinia coronata f. sp. avenae]
MSTHTAATQPEANQSAATQTTATVEKAIAAPPAEDTTAQLTAEEADTNTKAPVGTAEEPSTGSREGTHHTSATTADQTLVEHAEAAVPHSKPAAASESLPTSRKAAQDEPRTTPPIQGIAPAHPKTAAAAPPVQQKPSSHSPPATLPPVAMPSSHPGPSSSTRAARKPKTPTRKKLMRFLLPCFHPSMHDDSSAAAVLSSRPPPPHASSHHQHLDAQQRQDSSSQEMVEATATTTATITPTTGGHTTDAGPHLGGASSSLKSSGTTSRRSPMLIAKQHLRKTHKNSSAHAAAAPLTTRRSPSSQCLPTPVSDTVTPAGAAAATSAANAHGGGGVQVPIDETEGMLSGAVVPPGKDTMAIRKSASALRLVAQHQHHSSSSSSSSQHAADALAVAAGVHQVTAPLMPLPDKAETDEASSLASPDDPLAFQDIDDSEEDDDEEDRIVAMGGMGIPTAPDGSPRPLLAPLDPTLLGRKCLVLDLDETLVHSSFKVIPQSDFVVPVEIENAVHNVHVIKRPGVDEFMRKMGALYEVVVFTASLSKYADPVLDMLDIHHVVKHRLFRESCYNHKGNYVKDLSQLGRPIADTIIIDNSPASYVFHPNNAVPVSSWFNDPHDTELTDLAAFLTDIANVPDVRGILDPRL